MATAGRAANHPPPGEAPATVLAGAGFAPYRFTPGDSDHPATRLAARWETAGGDPVLAVTWPPHRDAPDDGWVIYRLVGSDGQVGYSPDGAHLIAATTGTTARDTRAPLAAVRHLQVWANVGVSQADALAAQPVLHAVGEAIAVPRDVEIREDVGRVVGQWTVPPGVTAVHIHRIPVDLATRDGPQFRILAGQQNLRGFADDAAEPGRRYLYRLRCEADVDGVARLSDPVQQEVDLAAVLAPVTDLTLTTHRRGAEVTFDLVWSTPPSGRVQVFRTPVAPSPDAAAMELDLSVLEQVGLSRDQQLTHPITEHVDEHGVRTSVMAAVPWPTGWTRAYFTPVTSVDGHARLGRVVSSVRTAPITDARITEYTNKQVLTFGWPAGAAAVVVYLAPKGYDPAAGLTGRCYEIALAEYEKWGGVQFTGDLPGPGCSVHLVPVAYAGGRRVPGAVTSIDYAGLLRLWYDVQVHRDRDGAPVTVAVRVRAEDEVIGSPPFVLVHNPDRIPLGIRDGRALDMTRLDAAGNPVGEPTKEFQVALGGAGPDDAWYGDVRGRQGWIRLFAHLPPSRLRSLALLDPPVAALRLTAGAAPK